MQEMTFTVAMLRLEAMSWESKTKQDLIASMRVAAIKIEQWIRELPVIQ